MKRVFFLIPLSIVVSFTSLGRSQSAESNQKDVAQYVQHLMDVHVGFTMVPPGTSIEAKEVFRKGKSGKDLVVQYHIFVKGIPPETLFQAIRWPVGADKPSSLIHGISVGKDGVLMCAGRTEEQCGDPKKPDDPIEFTFMSLKGEPNRLAFLSSDVKIGAVIVPDPVEASDKGCTLNAVRLTPKFELAFLSGSGYPADTDIHYRVVSTERTTDAVIRSDSKGVIRVSVVPFPGKKNKGTVTVKVTEAQCSPEVSYEWGTI
jgi:hypothetical protein